ncbi:MAG: dephospho-CoA kinase, partial [Planctomycetota bacterium]|nr:dephospho-CoA kinase [Planctomycetota bacterium]
MSPTEPSPPPQEAKNRTSGPVLGLVGGIASGKSAVARFLAGEGGTVLDADVLAREALETPAVIQAITSAWGSDLLGENGLLSRPALARRVFDDPQARRWLEGLTHPAVRARIRAGLEEARSLGRGPIVLDVPLLLESNSSEGLAALCDSLIFVASDPTHREARARQTRGWLAIYLKWQQEAATTPDVRKNVMLDPKYAQLQAEKQERLQELRKELEVLGERGWVPRGGGDMTQRQGSQGQRQQGQGQQGHVEGENHDANINMRNVKRLTGGFRTLEDVGRVVYGGDARDRRLPLRFDWRIHRLSIPHFTLLMQMFDPDCEEG